MSSNPSIEGQWKFSYLCTDCSGMRMLVTAFGGSFGGIMEYSSRWPIPRNVRGETSSPLTYEYPSVTFTIQTDDEKPLVFTFIGKVTDNNTIEGEWSDHYTGASTMTRF